MLGYLALLEPLYREPSSAGLEMGWVWGFRLLTLPRYYVYLLTNVAN